MKRIDVGGGVFVLSSPLVNYPSPDLSRKGRGIKCNNSDIILIGEHTHRSIPRPLRERSGGGWFDEIELRVKVSL